MVKRLSQASEFWGRLNGTSVFFSHDKYSELKEPYWFCSPQSCFEMSLLQDGTKLETGLRATKDWYEKNGWL